jgi:hypothetical protein
MSDAIQKLINAATDLFDADRAEAWRYPTVWEPVVDRLRQACQALQAMQGEADTTGMDDQDAMFEQIEYAARRSYTRHKANVKGQQTCRGDSYDSHLVWAAIEWAKANAIQQPAVPKWVGGHPPIETMAIMHIPMKGYPDYMVIGYMDEEGWIMDSSGDDAGYNADDVVRWMPAPALNSAAKEE